jgi:hypothetical protein
MPYLESLSLLTVASLLAVAGTNLVLLVVCWLIGDLGILVKVALTVAFLASFGLLFTRLPQSLIAVQAVLAFVVAFATFSTHWMPPGKGRGRGIVR